MSLHQLSSLNSSDENKRVLQKLPQYLKHKWSRMVDQHIYGDGNGEYPTFGIFCQFISDEARIANGPSMSFMDSPSVNVKHGNAKVFSYLFKCK